MKSGVKPLIALITLVFLFSGFQCASTEITSAKLYIQQKNMAKAEEVLKREIEKNPQSAEGFYLLGFIYGEQEKISDMVTMFDKSLAINKKFVKEIDGQKKFHWANYFNRGVAFFNRASNANTADSAKLNFEKSAAAFNMAVVLAPDSADTYKNLAFVYMNLQRYDDAVAPLEKMIALEKSLEAYRFLGEIYYTNGSNLKDSYDRSKKPEDSIKAMANFEKAIKVASEGKKHYPTDSELLVILSNSYIASNKLDVAMTTFEEGVKSDPNNKAYRYNYGVVLLGANNFSAAEEQFKKALEIDPGYLNAEYNLAVTYVKWGAVLQKKAEDEGKESPEAKEKYTAAVPYLQAYLDKKPDDAAVWELAGKVYSVLGKIEDAKQAFDKADKLRK